MRRLVDTTRDSTRVLHAYGLCQNRHLVVFLKVGTRGKCRSHHLMTTTEAAARR